MKSKLLFLSACLAGAARAEDPHAVVPPMPPAAELPVNVKPKGQGKPKDYATYSWPTDGEEIRKKPYPARLAALKKQMNAFSGTFGACLDPDKAAGKCEVTWAKTRKERLMNIADSGSIEAFCNFVRDEMVNPVGPFSWTGQNSARCQYANCAEGSYVGACLARAYGVNEEKILHCETDDGDHEWSLVPAKDPSDGTYCLLDRWNPYRCGVTITTKDVKKGVTHGTLNVPEVKEHPTQFADAFKAKDIRCRSFATLPASMLNAD